MADIVRLAREHTDLSADQIRRLRRLVADWGLIADLGFADLVLWLPTWNGGGFMAAAHQRPDTGRTLFADDVVGTFVARGRRPVLDRAMASASPQQFDGTAVDVRVYPLLEEGRVLGLLGRYSPSIPAARRGRLEAAYLRAADDLCAMVFAGDYPASSSEGRGPLRVGGGLLILDPRGVVTFASPNATSAFRRLGAAVDLEGSQLAVLAARLHSRPDGVEPERARVISGGSAGRVELEHSETILELDSVPLLVAGRRTGALVLVRDVSEVRSRERALVTSEATLREVHHRIKNNLQTVAALLRMQSRRAASEETRGALSEAGHRIAAIAVVHEVLSGSPESAVDFDEVCDRILALARDLAPTAEFRRRGTFGFLPSEAATPLAMCVAELVANAAEHGGPAVAVELAGHRASDRLVLVVADDGTGLPEDFAPERDGRLGVHLVQTLLADGGGEVSWGPAPRGGAVASVEYPLDGKH